MKRAGSKKVSPGKSMERPAAKGVPCKSASRSKVKGKASAKASPGAKRLRRATKSATPPPSRPPSPEEVAYRSVLSNFESGVNLFNRNDFTKARAIFRRLITAPARDLAERARVYLNICNQRLSRQTLPLKSAEDFYNYAVRMAN